MNKIPLLLCCIFYTPVFSQSLPSTLIKNISAVRTAVAPKIDGLLKDSVWLQALPATDFIINSPNYGQPATLRTEVWLLYDDEAIYVAAKNYDDPTAVRKQLTARDQPQCAIRCPNLARYSIDVRPAERL
jgi:hypothetical protein